MESSIHERTKQSQKQTEDRKEEKLKKKKKDQSQISWLWNKSRQMAFCLGQKKKWFRQYIALG